MLIEMCAHGDCLPLFPRVQVVVLPPEVRRSPGLPTFARTRGTIDEGREDHRCNKCRNCKQLGHTSRRYPNPSAPSSFTG